MNAPAQIEAVVTDAEAAPQEIAALEEAFRRAGLDVEVNAVLERKSAGQLVPWVVSVTLTVPIAAFLSTLATEAAKDAYPALKQWVKDVWNARSQRGDGSLALEDPEGSHVIIATRIPDEAIHGLTEIDWTVKRGHYLIWDEARDEWRDPTRAN